MKIFSFLLLALCAQWATAQGNNKPGSSSNPPNVGQFEAAQLKNKQDFISVNGNKFFDESGKIFIFRGVSIADPDNLVKNEQWNQNLFKIIHEWGANTIRLPVHPGAWRTRGQNEYLKLIDQAVVWANELDMYLIIDWHSIGYLETGQYQHPMYFTDKQETFRFWHDIAYRYQNVPTTAVYELFNEPTTLKENWGETEWLQWRETNERMIDIVYAMDKKVIPLVAGFNWAYDLRYVKKSPVRREGIAYVSHPYPQKAHPKDETRKSFQNEWEHTWGYVSKTYPMILTELGWVQADGYGAHVPVKDDGSYGPNIMDYMNNKGLSWIAWVFDPKWSPTMINNWEFEASEQGEFWRASMLELRNKESQ